MKLNEKIVFLALFFCIFIRFISGFPIDNSRLSEGTDTCFHLHRVWYVTTNGLPNWDYYIHGGQLFLRYYSPLAYITTGLLGRIVGFLFAYKVINNLIFALSVLVFFYFLKEFNLSTEKIIIALIFFSFFPIYSYYLIDGRFTSMFNIPLCLLYWIFLKRTIEKKKLEYLLLSGLFLALSILTHTVTTIIMVLMSFVWMLLYRMKIGSLYYFIGIMFIGLILSSWWTFPFVLETWDIFPFVLETWDINKNNKGNLAEMSNATNFKGEIITNIFTFELGPELILSMITITLFFCLLSLFTLKDKISRDFFVLTLLFIPFLFFFSFKRSIIFLPIPLSVVVAYGITKLKKWLKVIFGIVFFIVIMIGFFSIRPVIYEIPEYPDVPKDGRVIFLPSDHVFKNSEGENKFRCSLLIGPMNGNENILGWSIRPENINKTIVTLTTKKIKYDALIIDPLKVNPSEYYSLLKDGWVNYVVVNNNHQKLLNYFGEADEFRFKNDNDNFTVFEATQKSTYVETNNKVKSVNLTKSKDGILIDMNCEPGNVTIKETYDKHWKAWVNEEPVDIGETDHGFMQIKTIKSGQCKIELKFVTKKYYEIFNLFSIIGWLLTITYLFIMLYRKH